MTMKIELSTFRSALQFLARMRGKAMMLLLGLALGVGALSLGGCTCADGQGDPVACPNAYD